MDNLCRSCATPRFDLPYKLGPIFVCPTCDLTPVSSIPNMPKKPKKP